MAASSDEEHSVDTDDSDSCDFMSSDEEDTLDMLLQRREYLEEEDPDFTPDEHEQSQSQSDLESTGSQQQSQGDPLMYEKFSWQDDRFPDTESPQDKDRKFRPERPPGLQGHEFTRQLRKILTTPFEFLRLFLTQNIMLDICIATNQYASSLISKGCYSSYRNSEGLWTPVNEDELWRFFSIVIFMSFFELHSIDRYWKTDFIYQGVPLRHVMTKLRFKSILCFLQVVPPIDVDKSNKLSKIQPFLIMSGNFLSSITSHCKISQSMSACYPVNTDIL